jgi:hypothetical protein
LGRARCLTQRCSVRAPLCSLPTATDALSTSGIRILCAARRRHVTMWSMSRRLGRPHLPSFRLPSFRRRRPRPRVNGAHSGMLSVWPRAVRCRLHNPFRHHSYPRRLPSFQRRRPRPQVNGPHLELLSAWPHVVWCRLRNSFRRHVVMWPMARCLGCPHLPNSYRRRLPSFRRRRRRLRVNGAHSGMLSVWPRAVRCRLHNSFRHLPSFRHRSYPRRLPSFQHRRPRPQVNGPHLELLSAWPHVVWCCLRNSFRCHVVMWPMARCLGCPHLPNSYRRRLPSFRRRRPRLRVNGAHSEMLGA